jgi:hypothetical protein
MRPVGRNRSGVTRESVRVKPYRVEWRPDLVTQFVLIGSRDLREEADDLARESREKWGGQTRIISQHVIKIDGFNGLA